ncbi:integrase, catalytic region, zinc finger, CCHC-type containing protein [Tanacetum coccineum]
MSKVICCIRGPGNIEIPLNVRDSEETLEDAFKSQQKMNEKMNDPIAVANKQNCWTIDYKQLNALYNDFVPQKESFVEQTCSSSSYIPFVKILETKTMPSELPLINGLFNIKVGFEKLFLLIKQNSKRASMFYTSKEEIALNDFCRDQVKPLLNELLDYFDGFQNLFQRDIKEMKDAFEQNDVYLDEIERQNDLLKDQLLEASLKHDIELCVLLNHECVDKFLHDELEQVKKKSLEIQEGMNATSSVKGPKSRDSHVKTNVLDVSKNEAKKEAVYVRKNKQTKKLQFAKLLLSVASKSKIDEASASKARFKVVQIVLWVVDSGCSKHMTGDRSLLRNFVEKFMGTVRFGNDNFAAITGYGDYIHGNITICHVYYVEEGDDLLTGGRDSNLYTISISDMAASSPICLMSKATSTKSWDLDNLFGPMFEDYFEQKSSDTTINSAAQPTHDQEDSPSTSSIIVDTHEAPPVVTTSDEQTSPISLQESDEFNQEDSADFDGNTQFVPYDSLNHEEIESSTTNLEPSNVQNFHQTSKSYGDLVGWSPCMMKLNQFENSSFRKIGFTTEGKNVIALKWLWKNKCDADNIVVRNKTRLVAKGYNQEEGIDFEAGYCFQLLVLSAVRPVHCFCCLYDYPLIFQMDVKTDFLNGPLKEEVYVSI